MERRAASGEGGVGEGGTSGEGGGGTSGEGGSAAGGGEGGTAGGAGKNGGFGGACHFDCGFPPPINCIDGKEYQSPMSAPCSVGCIPQVIRTCEYGCDPARSRCASESVGGGGAGGNAN